jgi:2,4-dienoyl-CoA reductase-like NADH-dependent reductase (Old Yellow Enzyme family)
MRTRPASGVTRKSLVGKRFVLPYGRLLLALTRTTKITDSVHANGSHMFLQLWALGRTADPAVLKQEGGFDLVAPSAISFDNNNVPRELTVAEIKEYVQLYSKAASNAIKAGFDGVEIHAANGYLLDQFLQTVSNERKDEYGGSVDNRMRFPLEVVKAVVDTVGAERTAVRISPWSPFQGENDWLLRFPSSNLLHRYGYEGSASYLHDLC